MFQGFTTVNYFVDDLRAAIAWYADVLGAEPYFVRPDPENPAYAEFRIGPFQHELGLISSAYRPAGLSAEPGGATLYWQVDDVEDACGSLVGRGATMAEPVRSRGGGWVTASVLDPFGNVLGLMYSPLYAALASDRLRQQPEPAAGPAAV